MGVISDGNPYGVESDLMFTFPVKCNNGNWTFKDGLVLSEKDKKYIKIGEGRNYSVIYRTIKGRAIKFNFIEQFIGLINSENYYSGFLSG